MSRPDGHAGAAGDVGPPSAAGQLEPYGTRVILRPVGTPLATRPLLTSLLETLAADCVASGATVIGHLKCLLNLPRGAALACNLTSVLGGARCSGRGAMDAALLNPGEAARLDLAVLVYGLPRETIDALVRAVLGRLLDPGSVSWAVEAPGAARCDAH